MLNKTILKYLHNRDICLPINKYNTCIHSAKPKALATEIEREKEMNAAASFQELLKAVFEKFGEERFSSIVKQKEEYINQEYIRYHSSYVWSFFTLPKIILTIVMVLCLCLPLYYAGSNLMTQILRIYMTTMVAIGVVTVIAILLRFKKTVQPLLLLKGIKGKSLARNIGLILVVVLNSWGIFKRELPSGPADYIIGFVTVAVTISYSLIFLARYHAAQKMYSKAKKQYPLAFTSPG